MSRAARGGGGPVGDGKRSSRAGYLMSWEGGKERMGDGDWFMLQEERNVRIEGEKVSEGH